MFADTPGGGSSLITLSDGAAPPGFNASGTAENSVTQGLAFGIIVGGSNFDSDSRLNGTVTLSNFDAPQP